MEHSNKINLKIKNITIFLCFIIGFSSCESNEIVIDSDNLLLGVWVDPVYQNEKTVFKRGNALPENAYGISFKADGKFLERTSGWCGTPPLTFFNEEGSFTLNDGLITISANGYGYPSNYAWRIVSLSESELIVQRELTEQEIEHRHLMDLFNEISTIAYSVSCVDASNWKITPYGAKACGGSQGYLPYSNQINEAEFLEKVEAYTQAEKDYNFKWGIASDCAIVNPPKSVTCQNGFPILEY